MVTEVSWAELIENFQDVVKAGKSATQVGIMVFDPVASKWPKYQRGFKKDGSYGYDKSRPRVYKLENKSYYFFPYSGKFFDPGMLGNSLYASCVDGTDNHINLVHYMGAWKRVKCYLAGSVDEYKNFCMAQK